MYGSYSVYEDENPPSDREWVWMKMSHTYVSDKEIWIKEIIGYKWEEFKIFFAPDGKMIQVECTSSPWHSADKERIVEERVKNRLLVE